MAAVSLEGAGQVVQGASVVADGWRKRFTLPTLVTVAVLVAVVSSLGAPLVPSIARSYGVSLSTAQWLLTAALMSGALATPTMGRLADGPHKRHVIEVALGAVIVGCVVSALSTSFAAMVIGRGLQGLGLGLLPVTMAIARSELSGERSVQAVATLSVTAAVGVGLGYPLTGLITELAGFRGAFWFGAIAVAAALLLVVLVLPPRYDSPARKFDLYGAVSLGLAIVAISTLLSEGQLWGWTSPASLALGSGFVLLVVVWVLHELRIGEPLIDVRQVRNRLVLTADVSGFLIAVAMYLFLPVVVEFVQAPRSMGYGFGSSVVVSGMVLVPLSLGSFLASRCLDWYARHFGRRTMIPLGASALALSSAFFAFEHRALWESFVAAGLAGIGIGFTFAAMPGFIVRAVRRSETGSATGFYQVVRSVGLSIGSALAAATLTAYTSHGETFPKVAGFQVTLLMAAGLAVATAVISFVLVGRNADKLHSVVTDEIEETMEEEAEAGAMGLVLARELLVGETPEGTL